MLEAGLMLASENREDVAESISVPTMVTRG